MLDDCALHVSYEHDLDSVPTVILADPQGNEQRRFIGFGRQDWQETSAAPRSTYRDRAHDDEFQGMLLGRMRTSADSQGAREGLSDFVEKEYRPDPKRRTAAERDRPRPGGRAMRFYTFDETTYPGIPSEIGPEMRQTNRFCDPELAAQTYREHLEEWELCEELGYDGALVNEHHFTYFNINPSSTVLAAALIARTKRMKVGVIGHVLPLRHPVQTAEEFAQLDILSGGRFIGGIVRGVPAEYVSYNVDSFTSRERFAESYEIIQKCLTEELFDYEGQFYELKAVSIWPKPLQEPLPIWMPAGSAETIEFAAEHKIPIAQVWSPTLAWQDIYDYYKQVAKERFDWNPGPQHLIGARYIHVAETNEQAIEECREAVMYVRRLSTFSRPVQVPAPVPGIQTDRSFDFRKHPGLGMPGPGAPFEQLREDGFIVCGDPDYVSEWLRDDMETSGYGHFLGMFRVGSMKHEHVMKAKRLFAEQVMPRLRDVNPDAGSEVAAAASAAR